MRHLVPLAVAALALAGCSADPEPVTLEQAYAEAQDNGYQASIDDYQTFAEDHCANLDEYGASEYSEDFISSGIAAGATEEEMATQVLILGGMVQYACPQHTPED